MQSWRQSFTRYIQHTWHCEDVYCLGSQVKSDSWTTLVQIAKDVWHVNRNSSELWHLVLPEICKLRCMRNMPLRPVACRMLIANSADFAVPTNCLPSVHWWFCNMFRCRLWPVAGALRVLWDLFTSHVACRLFIAEYATMSHQNPSHVAVSLLTQTLRWTLNMGKNSGFTY